MSIDLRAFSKSNPIQTQTQEMERRGVSPNEVSYNTAIRACGDAGQLGEALALMDEMERKGVKASVVTYGTAVAACQRQGDWKMVRGGGGEREVAMGMDVTGGLVRV